MTSPVSKIEYEALNVNLYLVCEKTFRRSNEVVDSSKGPFNATDMVGYSSEGKKYLISILGGRLPLDFLNDMTQVVFPSNLGIIHDEYILLAFPKRIYRDSHGNTLKGYWRIGPCNAYEKDVLKGDHTLNYYQPGKLMFEILNLPEAEMQSSESTKTFGDCFKWPELFNSKKIAEAEAVNAARTEQELQSESIYEERKRKYALPLANQFVTPDKKKRGSN